MTVVPWPLDKGKVLLYKICYLNERKLSNMVRVWFSRHRVVKMDF